MSIDLPGAVAFMAGHARTLDRRRLELLLGRGEPGAVLAALEGYRNPDGGYGWGLEPDLRAPESQPAGALHAFEAIGDAGPPATPRSVELCDWLASATLPDGGLAFALPVADDAALAPFWAHADPAVSSLQITAYVAAAAQRVAAWDAAVAAHAWLARATRYCIDAIATLGDAPHALAINASVQLLDAVHDTQPEAPALLARLGELIPADGRLPVAGGAPDESLRPLDLAPLPGRPARALFDAGVVERDLERLAAEQQQDGGWRVDFASHSPAAALEWRGYATVRAIAVLIAAGGHT
ncbi:MAG: hypothetical protein ACLGI5_12865 [Thermoleophilia bacterium]